MSKSNTELSKIMYYLSYVLEYIKTQMKFLLKLTKKSQSKNFKTQFSGILDVA